MRLSGSTLGELGQRKDSGLGRGWWGVCIQTVSRSWGSHLGRGSWEDGTLVLWRLRSDFRLRRRTRKRRSEAWRKGGLEFKFSSRVGSHWAWLGSERGLGLGVALLWVGLGLGVALI